jgi:hypothetical protein
MVMWLSRGWWTLTIGRSLVCDANAIPSDAILVENFDPDYLLFERARNLRTSGMATRVLVPVPTDREGQPAPVALGIADLMANISRVGRMEVVPIRLAEPISLNAARDIRDFVVREGIRSVVVVSPLFRSRRSSLVYSAVLGAAGINVACEPVGGLRGVGTWTQTWHGIQDVIEQWIKLGYYKLYVLPRVSTRSEPTDESAN